MIYYITALLIYSVSIGFAFQVIGKRQNLVLMFSVMPLILLVVLRGCVGTDTASYLNIVSEISSTGTAVGIEQGFVYLIKALLYITDVPMFILVIIALITTSLLVVASLSTDRALLIFAFCIVPIFYLDMTMNGLRYGLSFSCAMYAVSKFYARHLWLSIGLGAAAVLFHSSGLLVFFIMALLAEDMPEFKRWLALIATLSLVVLAQLYFPDFFKYLTPHMTSVSNLNLEAKYIVYKQFQSPSWYSGLAPMVMSVTLLFILRYGNREHPLLGTRHVYILLALAGITFGIAKFSYAGLRLQFVVLFAILLMMQFRPGLTGIMDEKIRKRIFIVGCFGMLVFMKNVIETEGRGPSPFLPWSVNPVISQLWNVING